jgi:hypothetical protein
VENFNKPRESVGVTLVVTLEFERQFHPKGDHKGTPLHKPTKCNLTMNGGQPQGIAPTTNANMDLKLNNEQSVGVTLVVTLDCKTGITNQRATTRVRPYNNINWSLYQTKKEKKMKKIFMALIAIGTLANADFTKSGDIITDNTTGLQWQDDTTAASIYLTWQGAIDHCEAFTLGGYTDWRLPNKNELLSIVDLSRWNPAINNTFQNTDSNGYWSATNNASYTYYAWVVNFYHGDITVTVKGYSAYVRCVRAGV